MIDVEMLEKAILEHENKDTTYENCEILAWLYIVRQHLREQKEETNLQTKESSIQKHSVEKSNILPAYFLYIDSKKSFQQGIVSKESVLKHFDILSNQIKDFIKMLYKGSDMPEEREKINRLISEMNVGNI